MLNVWHIDKIHPDNFYRFGVVTRQIGISWETLNRWRSSGRLIVCTHNRSLVRGDHLLAAIKDVRPKYNLLS